MKLICKRSAVGCALLQAGVSKLKEAREVVDSLKKKAAQQSQILAEKQREADESMAEITSTIQVDYHLYLLPCYRCLQCNLIIDICMSY